MNKNNQWKILNLILIIIIIIILFVKCNNKLNNMDIYNINLSDKKNNCIQNQPPDDITIEDNNGNILYQQEINIFNSLRTIAPGISNNYYFTVKNQSNIDIFYLINLDNISKHNINIKYRLKRNNNYIVGNNSLWVTIEKLKTKELKLENNKIDNYILEWKWFDSDEQDNYIGKSKIKKYIVKLNFQMEENKNEKIY